MKRKLYLHLLLTFSLLFFFLQPLADVSAKTKTSSNKQTQIHLHLNKCAKDFSQVFVKINGEWKAMSNPGNSPLYKLLDHGEYVKDDISAFKFVTAAKDEVILHITQLKVGVEAQGTINYWLQKCPKPPTKNVVEEKTQISFDLNQSAKLYSKIYIKINGKWMQLTRKGNSTQYQLVVKGKLNPNSITEFKCITSTNKEVIIPVNKLKLDLKTKGTIQYWLETSQNGQPDKVVDKVRHTQIHLHLQKCAKDFANVFVKLNGKWVELTQQGNSPLFKVLDRGEYVKDDITEFKFVTHSNQEIILPVSKLKVGVEAEGTINYWLTVCPKVDAAASGDGKSAGAKGVKGTKGTKGTDGTEGTSGDGGTKGTEGSTGTKGTTGSEGTKDTKGTNVTEGKTDTPKGNLPKTGETSKAIFYLIGLALITLGAILLWKKKRGL